MSLEAVEKEINRAIYELNESDIIGIVSKIPAGKRLRARLMLEIAGDSSPVIKSAAIVEMIHAASLLHDDVIDNATTRRGVESINSIYGDKSAIMVGDILYSKAFFELVDFDKDIAKSISNAVVLLSIGERKDVYLSESFNPNEALYKEMIYQKTAVLIESASEVAAILAKKDREIYKRYGRNLGVAFQMIDDILDIISDSKTLGKPALSDFKEGKTTLPYIYLYNELDDEGKERLRSMHKKELSLNEQKWILENFEKFNIIQRCKDEALELINEAIELMHRAGEQGLEDIAIKMVNRSF
jgi:octaprenyl-diphosphate synthase